MNEANKTSYLYRGRFLTYMYLKNFHWTSASLKNKRMNVVNSTFKLIVGNIFVDTVNYE
jgi:hypothetical protein